MLWVLAVVVVLAVVILERAVIVATVVATWYVITNAAVVTWPLEHPWQTVLYAAGYFVSGAVWSVVKWWFVETARFRAAKDEFEQRHLNGALWAEFVKTKKTTVVYHSGDFALWIGFWPVSLVWTVLDDPVRRLVERMASELRGVYQRITDYVWQ